jgi:methionyl-tRNA synthetase
VRVKFLRILNLIRKKIDELDLNFYIEFIVNSLFEANKYFNDQEPWKKKDDIKRLNTIVYTTLEIVRKISFMLYPIIPQSSLNALKIFSINENQIDFSTIENHNYLSNLDIINKIDILFKKIEKNND